MRALANPDGNPALDIFIRWCEGQGIRPVPVTPADVALFVAQNESLGIAKLAASVAAISHDYLSRGLADPTFGPVSAELNRIAGLGVPRSWKKEQWPLFKALPYELQIYIMERDKQQETALRRAQNEAAKLQQRLIQRPEEANGKEHHAA